MKTSPHRVDGLAVGVPAVLGCDADVESCDAVRHEIPLIPNTAKPGHSTAGLFGSGRLIGRNLILTARHVVTPEGSAAPLRQVRLHAQRIKTSDPGLQ